MLIYSGCHHLALSNCVCEIPSGIKFLELQNLFARHTVKNLTLSVV